MAKPITCKFLGKQKIKMKTLIKKKMKTLKKRKNTAIIRQSMSTTQQSNTRKLKQKLPKLYHSPLNNLTAITLHI